MRADYFLATYFNLSNIESLKNFLSDNHSHHFHNPLKNITCLLYKGQLVRFHHFISPNRLITLCTAYNCIGPIPYQNNKSPHWFPQELRIPLNKLEVCECNQNYLVPMYQQKKNLDSIMEVEAKEEEPTAK